jgi:hypothetical protein
VTPLRVGWIAWALAVAQGSAPAAAEPPRCRVTADLSPARAFVGEQVHYRLRILRRHDVGELEWHTALSFPTFRSEWLPGVASEAPFDAEGESWREYLERRAIFPAHSGQLTIPAAALRCATGDGEEIAAVPALALAVDPLPAEGQPADFSGLVGPVTIAARASPSRLALGETIRVAVLVEGAGNVWVAPSPRAALEAIGDVDVFEHPEQLARDAGRELRLRQYRTFDLVPRRAGRLRVPELRVAYFDAKERRYAEASTPAVVLRVDDAPAPAGVSPDPPVARSTEVGTRLPVGWVAAGVAALGAAIAAIAVRRARRPARPPVPMRRHHGRGRPLSGMLTEDRLAEDLRSRIGAHLQGTASASAEEIVERAGASGPLRDAADLLVRVERLRFGGGGEPPTPEEILRVLILLEELRTPGR